jgi:glyoxylase I family protein
MSTYSLFAISLGLVVLAGCTYNTDQPAGPNAPRPRPTPDGPPPAGTAPAYRPVAVRYQVRDVGRSVDFYTTYLGFTLTDRSGPAFAMVANGNFTLWLSGPKSSGSRPMPDGTAQQPGGWNRLVLEVDDLPPRVDELKRAGLRFRNEIETGPGGRQVQIEDPDGNPVELFEPARRLSGDTADAARP